MDKRKEKKVRGFTLIELLVVIMIIGILMAFVIPAIKGVIARARKSTAQNSLREIAKAYKIYMQEKGGLDATTTGLLKQDNSPINSVANFAKLMAQEGLLNDPNCYCFSFDSKVQAAGGVTKKTIMHGDGKTYTGCFPATSPTSPTFSVNIVVGVYEDGQENTTPIAYTRGFSPSSGNGTLVAGDSVFSDGGYIAFLDGSVKWFDNATNQLMKRDMTNTTSLIAEAIPTGSVILTANGTTVSAM
jgi:prepilin-type N-terminal cleavage/methylation domain-containing protein